MKPLKATISGIILLALIISLNTRFGTVPPLGKFFDPDAGFWANAEIKAPESEQLNIPGLQDEVTVYFSERNVPHIFAQNEHDLYLAQGYIVARDRLFQLEMTAYDAAGRLSEILGEALVARDLETRRWGMGYGAEKDVNMMKEDPEMWGAVTAYAKGINAWIGQLKPADFPVEYKVLNISPEEWEPIKSAYLLKNMTRVLAARNMEDVTSNTLAYFGEDFVETYINMKPELNDPIIPPSTTWDFEADIPEKPDSLFLPGAVKGISPFQTPEGIGSNNWAVSGSKTASGYPILANDPHLGLTLPSIWYEMQLNAPGYNTYGVTLQGTPAIIIGFNEQIAWGTTNVGADVMDWYEVKFRDDSKEEYWHDGQWKPTTSRIEEIKVRGGKTVIDTVTYTHHGPVTEVRSATGEGGPFYHALRWIAHEPSNDLRTFYEFNKAENYQDYREAISHYVAPGQNFAFADTAGDIALWISAKLPKKWEYQGQSISDGTDPRYDWQGWIPTEQNPHVLNPERGFVSSANQESAAPDYPYYLEDDFAPFERGRRINELLESMDNITPQDMQKMQMDSYSYFAATLLPELLIWTDTEDLTESEREVFNLLSGWDHYMEAEKMAPTIFRGWRVNFLTSIFQDEFDAAGIALRFPSRDHIIELIKKNPDLPFIDNINTEKKETRQDLALESFKKTVAELTEKYGELGENWKWGYDINNDIYHLGRIPGFGAQDVFSSGSAEAINATRGIHGPSWRMVVELGPEVKGWGVYPGGQSGNPGSPDYDSMIEPWRTGELFELNFMKEEPEDYLYKLNLRSPE